MNVKGMREMRDDPLILSSGNMNERLGKTGRERDGGSVQNVLRERNEVMIDDVSLKRMCRA